MNPDKEQESDSDSDSEGSEKNYGFYNVHDAIRNTWRVSTGSHLACWYSTPGGVDVLVTAVDDNPEKSHYARGIRKDDVEVGELLKYLRPENDPEVCKAYRFKATLKKEDDDDGVTNQ